MTEKESRRFESYFVANDIISLEELMDFASRIDEEKEVTLEQLLMDEKSVTESQILAAKADALEIPFCELENWWIPDELLKDLDRDTLTRLCCMPIAYGEENRNPSVVVFAADDPKNIDTAKELSRIIGKEVELILGGRTDILKAIDKYFPLCSL